MNDGYNAVLASIESSSPTPGGGAVAALALSHGIALARMVAALTVGRDKWASGHASAESFLAESHTWTADALDMAQADCDAFDAVMAAYRLPKEEDEEIVLRKGAIRSANYEAAKSPLNIAKFCLKVMDSLSPLASDGNGNAITDAGSAAYMILAATNAAALNVRINLGSLGEASGDFESEINQILESVTKSHAEIIKIVENRM
jgi:formiminotetrahydrofolate cyclodeaminase